MSDILDDLKMMADHLDRGNGDEPCDLGMLLIRAIAEIRKQRGEQPIGEVPMPREYQGAKVGTAEGGEAYSAGYFDGRAAGYAAGVADAVPPGYWLAPMEPTSDMESAGRAVEVGDWVVLTWSEVAAIYREMRDAALRGEVKP